MIDRLDVLRLIEDEEMRLGNPYCTEEDCNSCPDILKCYEEAVKKSNQEYADEVNLGGYSTPEEFFECL